MTPLAELRQVARRYDKAAFRRRQLAVELITAGENLTVVACYAGVSYWTVKRWAEAAQGKTP